MLKQWKASDSEAIEAWIRSRKTTADPTIMAMTAQILADVREYQDEALYRYCETLDHVILSDLRVSEAALNSAYEKCDPQFIADLEEAKENILFFHQAQVRQGYELTKANDVYLGQRILPLERIGVYVPGGRSAYPSSVLMNVLPAKIANVKEIIMVTPPSKTGEMDPYIAAAAKIAGVDQIYTVGGAQAIAALAYGTQTIPRVDKIIGPGNIYVATAKKLVYGEVDIDMIAGPSEILVIADEGANPVYVAADLLSQAEHDPMASAILLTTSQAVADAVAQEVEKQLKHLPKKAIAEASLSQYGAIIVLDTIEQCLQISDRIAPEHLELMIKDAKSYLDQVHHAGSIFLGYMTCESIGDYFGGTNHVLPTGGSARFYSALNVDNFVKKSSYLHWSEAALRQDGNKIIRIAEAERLKAHANAVRVRLQRDESV